MSRDTRPWGGESRHISDVYGVASVPRFPIVGEFVTRFQGAEPQTAATGESSSIASVRSSSPGVVNPLSAASTPSRTSGRNPSCDAAAVMAKMKEMPTDDPLFGKGSIRVNGRKMHPMYLYEVKKPSESKAPWDYYKQIAVLPAEQAFQPLSESECPLVKK